MITPAPKPATQTQKLSRYSDRIPSLKELYPQLPPTLANFDLNKTINAGDALDIQDVIRATNLANLLKLLQETNHPAVNDEIVAVAYMRVRVIETPHIINLFGGGDTAAQAQAFERRLDGIQGAISVKVETVEVTGGMKGRIDAIEERLNAIEARLGIN